MSKKIRYAVVGLGHIAQAAVLPAFKNAAKNSELTALVSGNEEKLEKLGKKYHVKNLYSYEQYEQCLTSGNIDAVYIALPNNMHRDFSVRAAEAGINVLCEKPLGLNEKECAEMISVSRKNRVKLMTAYRLHFEKTNLDAIEAVKAGKIGEPQIFNSTFSFQVKPGNIRIKKDMGGGTLYDIGIYCINAARYLFQDEPDEVFASSITGVDERFREVDAITSGVLRFPRSRIANFTTSFASTATAEYELIGSKGKIKVLNAYEYTTEINTEIQSNGKKQQKTTSKRDQFGPELIYFSDCVLNNKEPEPSGEEGMADVRIIEALYRSARTSKPVQLKPYDKETRPSGDQEIHCPPIKEPELVKVESGSED